MDLQSSVFILKMVTLLPLFEKMPFFDTELLNLHCLFLIKFAVSIVLFMISSFLLHYNHYTAVSNNLQQKLSQIQEQIFIRI
jgi:hypothetical protein